MSIQVRGNGTFANREFIKDIGGKWDAINRCWSLSDFTKEHHLAKLRATPGIYLTEPIKDAPKPVIGWDIGEEKPKDDFLAGIVAQILAGRRNDETPNFNGEIAIHGNDETWLGRFNKQPTAFFGFASLADMIDFVEATPDEIRHQREHNRNSGWKSGGEWDGSRNMSEAIHIARNGWRDGVTMAKDAAEIIEGDHAQTRQRKHSVAGGRVNVGRLLSGSPMHMVHRPRQDGTKVITLLIDVWMAAFIDPNDAIIRAACVAAMCDVLEASGYSCEIVAVGSAFSNKCRMQIATNVKQAGDALNLEDVTFALGHPSMLRRLCFAVAANEPRLQSFWMGMGRQEPAFVDCDPGMFYINKLETNLDDDDFDERVREAFELIVPDEFPINLSDDH